MSAAANPAITTFVKDGASASSLSSLVEALKDTAVAGDLCRNSSTLQTVLERLLAVANDNAKSTAVRFMSLECLYEVSAAASEEVCHGVLFQHVQRLNESFDAMMEQESADALSSQREMLAVLLLRCTGYTRLTAGDVLHQLCHDDESSVMALLVAMLRNDRYEWPLAQAALRWLYELTTPATYFDASTSTETTKVHAFQAKVGSLLEDCVRQHSLPTVASLLVTLWERHAQPPHGALSGGLAACDSITQVTVLSSSQQRELLQWAVVLRYFSVLVHNFSEFCEKTELVRTMQQCFMGESQRFLAAVLVPFIMAVTHAWERGSSSQDATAGMNTQDPYLNASVAALRLLRFALYHSSANTAAASSTTLTTPLLSALRSLAQLVARLEPVLKQQYPGMLVLLLTVQCLCNVDAIGIREGSANLASSFEVLISTIANDKAPIRADNPYPASLAFAVCFTREESTFVVTQNASVKHVHAKLSAEEAELQEDAETIEAIVAMQEQLEYLQAVIMQAALGQLLAELGAMAPQLADAHGAPAADGARGHNVLLGRRPSTVSPAVSPSTHAKKAKKLKHPKQYCCDLTGKLMREPVTLKNGHHFEYDALMGVVEQVGHVDPLTGEAIAEELEVDEALRQEIADYRVSRAASRKASP